jgi:tetratricopeptide (TPR) repeat protein
LLSGVLPFDPKELRRKAYAEIQRIIREVEPPPPSTRLNALGPDARSATASHRHSDPGRLSREIRGDLDWIVMRCLEKDRKRRYSNVGALVDDLRRHLADRPVEARRPTRGYRFRKFVRRHRFGVVAGGAVVTALVVGLVLASAGFLHARHQTRMLRKETSRTYRVYALMVNAEARGNSQEAEDVARQALEMTREFAAEDPFNYSEGLHALAHVLAKRKPDEAIALEREAIAIKRRLLSENQRSNLPYSLDVLAGLLAARGEAVEAERLYREALPLWRGMLGNDHVYVANTLDRLSALLAARGARDEAIASLRECVAIRRKVQGENHSATTKTAVKLSDLERSSPPVAAPAGPATRP